MNLVEKLIALDSQNPRLLLVVGDSMTDIYVHGRLHSTCQEDCPKFSEEDRISVPGGAENAARSLEHWKTKVVCYRNYVPTKTRFMAGNRCIFRHDDESVEVDTSPIREESMLVLSSPTRPVAAVLLSDYDKGTLIPDFISEVSSKCWQLGIPCVVDCKRSPELYHGCILKGNVEWFNKYKPNMLTSMMVITNGWDNPTVEGRMVDVNRSRVPCVNHVGAGDCFAAHLTLALAHEFSLKEAATVAHSAGRVYVQYPHNRPPGLGEIVGDMDKIAPTHTWG